MKRVMQHVSQHPHPLACQHACIAMLANVPLEDVICIVGHAERMSGEDRARAAKAFGVGLASASFLLAPFAMDAYKNLAALMREHETLWCSVNDYRDPRYGHAVIIHEGRIYDPCDGIDPTWPWSRVISQASPVRSEK